MVNKSPETWKTIATVLVFIGTIAVGVAGGVWAADEKYDQSNDVKEIKKEVVDVEQRAVTALSSVIVIMQSQRIDDLMDRVEELEARANKSEPELKELFKKRRKVDSAQKMIDRYEK